MIYDFLDTKEQILNDNKPGESLTVIADNCSGQNKTTLP
jgi:hypothetical protein